MNAPRTPAEQLLAAVIADPDAKVVARAEREQTAPFLVFRIGPHWYGVPATSVVEVVPYLEPVAIPGVPTLVAGVVNLGGRIVSVLDLSVLLGLGRGAAPAESARCVVLQVEGLPVATVPDELLGLITVQSSALQVSTDTDGLASATFSEGGRLVTVISCERLLERAEAQVGEGGRWTS